MTPSCKYLTFKEFRDTYCLDCSHCVSTLTNNKQTNFCYDLYKKSPAVFVSQCYSKLLKNSKWPTKDIEEHKLFTDIFCKADICKHNYFGYCRNYEQCLLAFILQITERSNSCAFSAKDKSYKNYNTKKPSITVLCGGSKEWVKKVKGE